MNIKLPTKLSQTEISVLLLALTKWLLLNQPMSADDADNIADIVERHSDNEPNGGW